MGKLGGGVGVKIDVARSRILTGLFRKTMIQKTIYEL